jgi:hypothetical protein
VDNIKINLREIGWDGVDWIDLAQDRDQWRALVNTVSNLRVPSNSGKFLSRRFGRREEEKNLSYRNSNSDPSVVQPVASRYTDKATSAPLRYSIQQKKSLRIILN